MGGKKGAEEDDRMRKPEGVPVYQTKLFLLVVALHLSHPPCGRVSALQRKGDRRRAFCFPLSPSFSLLLRFRGVVLGKSRAGGIRWRAARAPRTAAIPKQASHEDLFYAVHVMTLLPPIPLLLSWAGLGFGLHR
ncbi:hypothetical protein BHE74_00007445 [Ensete ventricosum]|nr:hypothetical protein GW17_00009627 [Ensete ventricosum]RWW84002.1 hypothetical protein BHE74_00007445 [Ensete ventricosum]RZR80288.1 hypothetical protein BHM03_00006283 [Ensete ventricosum]